MPYFKKMIPATQDGDLPEFLEARLEFDDPKVKVSNFDDNKTEYSSSVMVQGQSVTFAMSYTQAGIVFQDIGAKAGTTIRVARVVGKNHPEATNPPAQPEKMDVSYKIMYVSGPQEPRKLETFGDPRGNGQVQQQTQPAQQAQPDPTDPYTNQSTTPPQQKKTQAQMAQRAMNRNEYVSFTDDNLAATDDGLADQARIYKAAMLESDAIWIWYREFKGSKAKVSDDTVHKTATTLAIGWEMRARNFSGLHAVVPGQPVPEPIVTDEPVETDWVDVLVANLPDAYTPTDLFNLIAKNHPHFEIAKQAKMVVNYFGITVASKLRGMEATVVRLAFAYGDARDGDEKVKGVEKNEAILAACTQLDYPLEVTEYETPTNDS